MLDQELQKLWQESPLDMQVKFNKSELLIDLNHSINGFKRAILFRDIAEIAVSMLIAIAFGRLLLYESDIIAKVGSGIIVCGALLIIFKLLAVKRFTSNSPSGESFKRHLEKHYLYLSKEKHLLKTVTYWYILPFFIGYIILGLGVPLAFQHWGMWLFYILYVLSGAGVSRFVWWLNHRTVNKQFNPMLERIDTALKNLESH